MAGQEDIPYTVYNLKPLDIDGRIQHIRGCPPGCGDKLRAAIVERDETITCLKTQMAELKANEQRHVLAYISQNFAICQTLGRVLGYVESDGSVNVCDHTAETLAEEAAKKIEEFKTENHTLRKLLFLRHGCGFNALYGDDGELQCQQCHIDFIRMPADEISKRFEDIGWAKVQENITNTVDHEAENARIKAEISANLDVMGKSAVRTQERNSDELCQSLAISVANVMNENTRLTGELVVRDSAIDILVYDTSDYNVYGDAEERIKYALAQAREEIEKEAVHSETTGLIRTMQDAQRITHETSTHIGLGMVATEETHNASNK